PDSGPAPRAPRDAGVPPAPGRPHSVFRPCLRAEAGGGSGGPAPAGAGGARRRLGTGGGAAVAGAECPSPAHRRHGREDRRRGGRSPGRGGGRPLPGPPGPTPPSRAGPRARTRGGDLRPDRHRPLPGAESIAAAAGATSALRLSAYLTRSPLASTDR